MEKDHTHGADLIIDNCSILTSAFEFKNNQCIVIKNKKIEAIGDQSVLAGTYHAVEQLSGKGKLVMPGLVDAHTHTNQQLLRGRITDEYPMIWTRIMVPFESNLREKDVYISTKLSCLEMIRSGTTGFIDAGGRHMHQVAEAVIKAGLRAVITCSTMDNGKEIPATMKASPGDNIRRNEQLFKDFQGAGDGRLDVWFSLRSLISCSADLVLKVFEAADSLSTGVQTHMNEYPNEISYCLENFRMRPYEFLESLGVLHERFLGAHSILLSENEMDIIKKHQSKIVHCPISNAGKGIPNTPGLLQKKMDIGMGTDGAAHSGLSLFDQMKVFKSMIRAGFGVPIHDPAILPSASILEMATSGGAEAMMKGDQLGTLDVGKKADLITINIDQPHIQPTHSIVNTLIESVNSNDVTDTIIDGNIVMKNREVLTLDEEKTIYESRLAAKDLFVRANLASLPS